MSLVINEGRKVARPAKAVSPESEPAGPRTAPGESPADVLRGRCAFLEITEEDCQRVREVAGQFEELEGGFVDRFYTHLFTFPATAEFLKDPELVGRLRELQKQYFESLFKADLGPEYVEGRRRIGQAHADVGLEPQWFLGAFNLYIQHCFRHFAGQPSQRLERYVAVTLSLLKLILLDTGLALDAYFTRATEQLRRALELYEQSNTELREFAHLTSHDLKTPLATVSALCEEFLDEFGPQVPEEGRKMIETARSRTLKMKNMIDELLSMSETAAQPEQRANVSMRALFDDVLDRIRPEIGERQIRLEVPDQMPTVSAHPGRLREVFYQLLSNAVKFMDKEPGTVRVGVEHSDSEDIFCVSDTGPGISKPDQNKIFAPFQRLPQHRNQPGSGLGLYFVRRILQQRGGRVWVESRVGDGSMFYVAIPRTVPAMNC